MTTATTPNPNAFHRRPLTGRARALLTVAAALLALAALSLSETAVAGPIEPEVPTGIAVPEGHKLFLVGHAVGVQIYACNATPGGHGWSFVGPEANVYSDNGQLLTTHFGGPSWQAKDGSKVVAQRFADPVVVDPTAIPWLLLSVVSATPGPEGDRLVGTTFIQRVATNGGLMPPQSECGAGNAGTTRGVPYTADYAFWKQDD